MAFSTDFLRVLLVLCFLGMALLAIFFLQARDLTHRQYIGWGLLILLVPLVGPFLVILLKPGQKRR
jgi:hypothetical protein